MKKIYLVILIVLSFVTIFKTSNTIHSQTTSAVTKHELSANPPSPYTETNIPFTDSTDSIYYINDNLTINGNNLGTHTGVVFVEKNLNIDGNYCYGSTCPLGSVSGTIGTVFVVGGNVNIAQNVNRVDAVIIAQGKIYTTGAGCSQSLPVLASQLVINGSLISLVEGNTIEFCRTLSDNSQPAEKINHQVKYLVILRDLLSDTYQNWSEIP